MVCTVIVFEGLYRYHLGVDREIGKSNFFLFHSTTYMKFLRTDLIYAASYLLSMYAAVVKLQGGGGVWLLLNRSSLANSCELLLRIFFITREDQAY